MTTSSVLQPQTMKRRLQSVVRRSLSKIRHEPPPVPPKDGNYPSSPSASTHSRSRSQPTTTQQAQKQSPSRPARPAIPPHYYHNYTQTECDGRHYEPSSPISPDYPTSTYHYEASKGQRYYGRDEVGQYDLDVPFPSAKETGTITSPLGTGLGNRGSRRLSLNMTDHGSPLIPRQELMVLSSLPAEEIRSSSSFGGRPKEEKKKKQEVTGFKAGPVYGQSYGQNIQVPQGIGRTSELDRTMEEDEFKRETAGNESALRPAPHPPQQNEKPTHELKREEAPVMAKGDGKDPWERREGEHAWDFTELRETVADDGRGDIGKAMTTEGEQDQWTGPSPSNKDSDDDTAYHHVSVPAEEAARGKGKDEYAFPRTVPDDTVDSTVEAAPAVVHETVQPEVHEVVQQQIHRDIHHYDEHYRIQPVVDLKVLPTRHIFIDSQGNASELHFEGGRPPPGFEFGKPF